MYRQVRSALKGQYDVGPAATAVPSIQSLKYDTLLCTLR